MGSGGGRKDLEGPSVCPAVAVAVAAAAPAPAAPAPTSSRLLRDLAPACLRCMTLAVGDWDTKLRVERRAALHPTGAGAGVNINMLDDMPAHLGRATTLPACTGVVIAFQCLRVLVDGLFIVERPCQHQPSRPTTQKSCMPQDTEVKDRTPTAPALHLFVVRVDRRKGQGGWMIRPTSE